MNEVLGKLYQKFDEIDNPLSFFSNYVAPHLVGEQYDLIRKAVLLMLASDNDHNARRRIHILLYGAAGTGKTEVLLWLKYNMGVNFISHYTTEVGLIGDVSSGYVTPGELARSDGGVLAIDELDKFNKKDLNALLEAMEEGEYRIRKGKVDVTFNAMVRVIATVNDVKVLPMPLRDRFDFIFHVQKPSRDERIATVERIIDSWLGNIEKYSPRVLQLYLEYIKDFEPSMVNPREVKKYLAEYIKETTMPVERMSYRSFELSILRIAYAIAKFERKDVTLEHIKKAIKFKEQIYLGGYGDGD